MTEVTKEVTFCCYSVNQDKHDTRVFIIFIAFEQPLRGALAAGLEKEWNLNSTSNLPVAPRRLSCEIFANQLEVETSANVKKKHWKARANGNDFITNVISANQHFASTLSMQIFNFQKRSCKLSFLFPPRRQSGPESLLAGYYFLPRP